MLSEKGSLKETPVMKLLLTLFEQALTGILYLKKEDALKVLYFNRGKLIWAISNSDDDKLENILITRNMVERDVLTTVKREAHVSDSIGKLLVGKGLITLEELIDSSKAQLKRIIQSVLKWNDGGFQFVKDTPPERLLSLDLNITDFIIAFILDEMDISEIWKEIGSLQVEFIKTPEEKKITRYNLSLKQLELLNSFTGENKLETILSRYSGGHRESLLKIIYFFLMSELLIKKEFELNDSSIFDEVSGFDYFQTDSRAFDNRPDTYEPAPAATVQTPPKDSYVFGSTGKLEKPEEEPLPRAPEPRKPVPPPAFLMEEKNPDIRKIKMFNVLLIILIPIVAGVILLYLAGLFNEDPLKKMMMENEAAPENSDIITIEEKGAPAQKDETGEQTPPTVESTDTGQPEEKTTDSPKEEQNGKPVENVVEKKVETLPAKSEEKKEERPKLPAGKKPFDYFREGSLITAADVWKEELKRAGVRYAILLELDCLKESVINAFDRLERKDGFFILPRPSRGKTCFLVMWGKYTTSDDAARDLKSIPSYFWGQQNPPEVIDITKYLR
jgi:hypothetical protein